MQSQIPSSQLPFPQFIVLHLSRQEFANKSIAARKLNCNNFHNIFTPTNITASHDIPLKESTSGDLFDNVLTFLTTHRVAYHQGVLAAVSGGVDSMVMLHVLAKLNSKVAIAHCNFQLRDNES